MRFITIFKTVFNDKVKNFWPSFFLLKLIWIMSNWGKNLKELETEMERKKERKRGKIKVNGA